MFLEDVLKEFLFDCQLRKLSPRTLKGYKNNSLALFRFLKTQHSVTKLHEVNFLMIQEYIKFLAEKKLSEVYINGLIKTFRAFFKYCYDAEYISRNPMDKIRLQKEPDTMIVTFNDDEVAKMLRYCNGKTFLKVRNALILTMFFDSGIRNAELCELLMTDMRETHIRIMGKGKKERYVPITPAINKALIQYMRVREHYIKDKPTYETQYLVLSQKGRKLTIEAMERIVRDVAEAVGVREEVRASPHTCRHYYAQAQLRNGCDLYTLSRLLGHSKVDITKIYLKSMQEDDFFALAVKTSPLMNLKR